MVAGHCGSVETSVRQLHHVEHAQSIRLRLRVECVDSLIGAAETHAEDHARGKILRSRASIKVPVDTLRNKGRISAVAAGQRVAEVVQQRDNARFGQLECRSHAVRSIQQRETVKVPVQAFRKTGWRGAVPQATVWQLGKTIKKGELS